MKKRLFYLLVAAMLQLGAIAALYELSRLEKSRPNGFIRLEPPHVLLPGNTKDLKVNSFYIAGLTADSIYLANRNTPYQLLITGYDMKGNESHRLPWPKGLKIAKGAMISLDSATVYLNDGVGGQQLSM